MLSAFAMIVGASPAPIALAATSFPASSRQEIFGGEFVEPLLAMGLPDLSRHPIVASQKVFARADLLKMIRPDAERVLAFVVDLRTAKDRADKSRICETVNQNSPGVDKESDVAVISSPCGPIPTSIGLIDFGPKRSHRVWYSPHTLERSIRKRYGK